MNLVKPFLFAILSFMVFSCGQKSNDNVYTGEVQKMYVDRSDSIAIEGLIGTFVDHLIAGRVDDAVYMLFDGNEFDANGSPCQLTEEQCQKLVNFYKQWHVTGYKISKMYFSNYKNNEVRCQLTIDDLYSVSVSFKPMRILGQWILCVKDSESGDRPL